MCGKNVLTSVIKLLGVVVFAGGSFFGLSYYKILNNFPLFENADLKQTKDTLKSIPSVLSVGSELGKAQCLDFGKSEIAFDALTSSNWKNWSRQYHYSTAEQHLSVVEEDEGAMVLRQKFEPTDKGSDRVRAGIDLKPSRSYRITQSVFFESGWEWGGDTYEGGKLGFGFGGGTKPSGGTVDPAGFTARIMWRGHNIGGGQYDGTGRLVVYSYAADRPDTYGEDHAIGELEIPIGEWFTVTYEIRANSSIGVADGGMSAWINGELLLKEEGVAWQLEGETPQIDSLSYASFYGGADEGWAPSDTTYARFRNVCWAPVDIQDPLVMK